MLKYFTAVLFVACLAIGSAAYAQCDASPIDQSQVAASGANANAFAPAGWTVEQEVRGDLNGDGRADLAIKLVEAKKAGDDADNPASRQRALVIALAGTGNFQRAAVAGKLLQCTRCGGAFYGVVEAPAEVKIENGVIIVSQDHGSRDVTEATYRIRYDKAASRFVLIGMDLSNNDRANGGHDSVSTNYLTGVRISTTKPAKRRARTKRTTVSRAKKFVEDIDHEAMESME